MQKIARASQSRIVFGYITALQMLRMAQPCELASVRSGKPSIPERAPRTKELSSALERIEGDHPGLRFERPSHVLVSTPNGRAGELCVPHVCARGFSRSSFFRLGDDVFFSKPELAFIQMATRIRNEVSLLELGGVVRVVSDEAYWRFGWIRCRAADKRSGFARLRSVQQLARRCAEGRAPSFHFSWTGPHRRARRNSRLSWDSVLSAEVTAWAFPA